MSFGVISHRTAPTDRETLDLSMAQVVRVAGERIVEFRPFYWNVPAYQQAVKALQ